MEDKCNGVTGRRQSRCCQWVTMRRHTLDSIAFDFMLRYSSVAILRFFMTAVPQPVSDPDETSRLDAKAILTLVQTLAIVVGGCWVLFLYFSFQKSANRVALEQQQLALEQSKVVQKTQEQSNTLDLALKQLSVQQGKLLLATTEAEKQYRKQELISAVELKKQEIELNKLKKQQQQHDVEFQTSSRYLEALDLTPKKIREIGAGTGLYEIETRIHITNTSTVPIEIRFWCVDYYATDVPEIPPVPGRTFSALQIPLPPDRFQSWQTSWEKVGNWSAVYSRTPVTTQRLLTAQGLLSTSTNVDGLGTGVWKPGQSMDSTLSIYVRAPYGSRFASAVSIMFDGGAILGITKSIELLREDNATSETVHRDAGTPHLK